MKQAVAEIVFRRPSILPPFQTYLVINWSESEFGLSNLI